MKEKNNWEWSKINRPVSLLSDPPASLCWLLLSLVDSEAQSPTSHPPPPPQIFRLYWTRPPFSSAPCDVRATVSAINIPSDSSAAVRRIKGHISPADWRIHITQWYFCCSASLDLSNDVKTCVSIALTCTCMYACARLVWLFEGWQLCVVTDDSIM